MRVRRTSAGATSSTIFIDCYRLPIPSPNLRGSQKSALPRRPYSQALQECYSSDIWRDETKPISRVRRLLRISVSEPVVASRT